MNQPKDYDPYQGRTRAEYLRELADERGIPIETVNALADMLGPNEDFDGLITSLEDAELSGVFS
jgi:hypothetical protein